MEYQVMSQISTIEACLKEVVKPDYTFKVYMDTLNDHLYIRVSNTITNMNQTVTINAHIFHYSTTQWEAMDQIIDILAKGTSGFDVLPRYWRNFEFLMEQILYSEYEPGKLY